MDKAVLEAETIANKLSTGELDVLTLRSEDRLAYVRAVEILKPTGIPIEIAALHVAEAVKLLDGASFMDAIRYYAKMHPHKRPVKTVNEVMEELLGTKKADGMNDVYLKDLRGRLRKFGDYFRGTISFVTTKEIENFLRSLKLSGRSRNNYRRAIGTLLYFAESRDYLAKGVIEVESVAVAKENEGEIEIFTPEELAKVFASAEDELIPFVAIGAFAGLRHAEILRLDWSEVRLDDGFIEVKASKAKTASRRLVPISDNLKLWLAPHKRPNGAVCPYVNMSKQLLWLAEEVHEKWQKEKPPKQFAWKHNALRHSFISYRLAKIQNAAQVALEAGNSPQMIFKHYRELVRPADAEKWFSIVPEEPANVIQVKSKRAA